VRNHQQTIIGVLFAVRKAVVVVTANSFIFLRFTIVLLITEGEDKQ
jgi:hypothetical protein